LLTESIPVYLKVTPAGRQAGQADGPDYPIGDSSKPTICPIRIRLFMLKTVFPECIIAQKKVKAKI
jgi:hypothetical protein